MLLLGTYAGIVENAKDPERLGRVKARVPHVYGATSGAGAIGTDDIPWAWPAGMPAGATVASGGFSMLPEVGDKVWVRFLDGEPEKPVWEWGSQTVPDVANFKLHQYDTTSGRVGKPNATRWTRNGHLFEINPDSALATTSMGYRLVLTDGADEQDGTVLLSTSKGNFVQMDDASDTVNINVNQDLYFNITDEIVAIARSMDFTTTNDSFTFEAGADFSVTTTEAVSFDVGTDLTLKAANSLEATAAQMSLEAEAELTLKFAILRMGQGSQPFVLGNQLVAFLDSLLAYLAIHTHTSGSPGSPTSPPTIPPVGTVQPFPSLLISETIFGS